MLAPASVTSPPLLRSLLAGATGAVVTLAIVLSLGLLAFAPAGASAPALGLAAMLANCAGGALVFALLARCPLPCGGPSSATCIVLAGLAAHVVAQPGAGTATLVLACGAAVAGMGVLQVLLGVLRLGRLASYVPQPVLSGFMNGVAVLVVLAQWPLLASHPGAAALALGTAAAVWLIGRAWPGGPAALLALALAALLAQLLPDAAVLGPAIGVTDASLPLPPWTAAGNAGLLDLAPHIALTSALLALTGSLEGLLSLRVLDRQVGARSDADQVLMAAGAANIAGGLMGALPLTLVRSAATAMAQQGASGRLPVLVSTLCSAALLALAGQALGHLPAAALAGVMLTIGVALADRWSHGLLQRAGRHAMAADTRRSLAVVAAVMAATVWAGTAAGVGLGLLLAMLFLVQGMQGTVVRSRVSGEQRPSRRVWPDADEARLAPLRAQILLLELQGALFFGSAQRVADACDELPPGCRFVVLCLRRVSTLDESGAAMLEQLRPQLAQQGVRLLLAGVDSDRARGQRLAAFGLQPGEDWHPDADRALEAAERALLVQPAAGGELPLAASSLLHGVDAAGAAIVDALAAHCTLAAGEHLFREGDGADALYVVTCGSVSVTSADGRHRYLTLSPGTLFGEMALLDGGGRTADAVADEHAELRRLSHANLQRLQAEHPVLAARLYRNIARHLSQRLRAASSAWHAAAG